MGMKVLKYGVISSTTTINLDEELDPSKYKVGIHTNARIGGYTINRDNVLSYGQGAYLSAKTPTSCTIEVSTGITASYEIIQLSK